MQNKRSLPKLFKFITFSTFGLAILLGGGYLVIRGLRSNLENHQLLNTPPTVIVHSPSAGDTALESDTLPASATATGINPIVRLELWIDGNLDQQQSPDPSLGTDVTTFRASFEIDMAEGTHMIVFRALDSDGLIGQSIPIPVTGILGETTMMDAEEGQTLDDIAQAQGVEPDILHDLNPDLGGGGLPGGTNVVIPVQPPPGGGGAQDQLPGAPNQPPGNLPVDIIMPDPLPIPDGAWVMEAAKIPSLSIGDLLAAFAAAAPKAPTSLQTGFKDCAIQLQWYDNAEDETHFNIWMQRVYGPPQLIETTPDRPGTGPVWYEFKSPSYGFYNFWVEAVNALGSQPTEIRQVFVSDGTCGSGIATELEIAAEDMVVLGSYESVYCYLSLEGHPERRIPEGKERIPIQNSFGDITQHWGGNKSIYYPMPADEILTLEGECLGVQGGHVFELGTFGANVPREKWDGSRLELKPDSGGYIIGYHIKPAGSEQAQGSYQYVDYDLNAPQVWRVEAEGELQIPEKDWKARTVTVHWHWQGNPDDITSFVILIDGEEFRYASKIQRQESILLGTACGHKYAFQVIAVGSEGARSRPSLPEFIYEQPPCPVFAEVKFLTASSTETDDQSCEFPNIKTCYSYKRCDVIDIYYELFALGAGHDPVVIKVGTENMPVAYVYKCDVEFGFTTQLEAPTDTIIVPIDPNLPEVRVGTVFWESDQVKDDRFGLTGKDIKHPYDQWPAVDEDFTLKAPTMGDTADLIVTGHIRGLYYPGP